MLPDFRLADAYAGKWVNARDLLTHRVGFPAFFGDLFDHLGYGHGEVLRRIRCVKPASSFRDRAAYSNIGFFLAEELAANAGGQPFEELTRALVLHPLGLQRTGTASALIGPRAGQPGALADVSRSHALVGGAAAGGAPQPQLPVHRRRRLRQQRQRSGPLPDAAGPRRRDRGPACALGGGDEGTALAGDRRGARLRRVPPIDADADFDDSPGWGMYHYNGLKVLEKGGALDGVRTLVLVVPRKRFGVAVLANRSLTVLPEAARAALLQQAFGRPGEADLQPRILARGRELESRLLAAEPQPADPKPPAHRLSAYAGTYGNNLFGSWRISERGGSLEVLAGRARYRAALTPWDGETLRLRWPGERFRIPGSSVPLPVALCPQPHGQRPLKNPLRRRPGPGRWQEHGLNEENHRQQRAKKGSVPTREQESRT